MTGGSNNNPSGLSSTYLPALRADIEGLVGAQLISFTSDRASIKVDRDIQTFTGLVDDGREIRVVAGGEKSRRQTSEIMFAIWKSNNTEADKIAPEPYGYLESYNAVVYENIKGTPLATIKKIDRLTAATLGQKLCSLHGLKVDLPLPEIDIKGLVNACSEKILAAGSPAGLPNLKGGLISCYNNLPRLTNFIHGDFRPGNIIVEDEKVSTIRFIDFSEAKFGDPLYDVGSLGAHLQMTDNTEASKPFYDSYRQFTSQPYLACFDERLSFYVALEFLQNAAFVADLVTDPVGRMELINTRVNQGIEALK